MAQTKNISAAFSYQGKEISYTLCFDRFKTVRLRMKEANRLEIKAPFHTPLTAIENSMRKHAEWIFARQEQLADMQTAIKPVTEEVFIFGKSFGVTLRKTSSAPLEKYGFSPEILILTKRNFFHGLCPFYKIPVLKYG